MSKAIFLFIFFSISLSVFSKADIYPVMAGVNLNNDFKVRINDGSGYKNVPVQDIVDVCFAHFALSGSVDIEITAPVNITTYRIGPERLGIAPVVNGKTMTFTITNPTKLIILINSGAGNHTTGLDGLCIIADIPETDIPSLTNPNVVNIMSYGVDNTGNTLETSKIQKAFNDHDGNRKIIYFPAGIYKSGQLHVRAKQSVYFAPGAVLMGSSTYSHYARIGTEGSATEKYLLGSWQSDSIRIYGRGIINGNGTALRTQDPTGDGFKTHNIQFQGSSQVTIEGIISLDAGSWSIEPIVCDDLLISNVKVLSDLRYYGTAKLNTDGIDINKCRDVMVENCLVYACDDALTPKMDLESGMFPLRSSYNITFKDNIVYTRKCGVKIGSETRNSGYEFYNIVVDGLDVVFADRALSIWSADGALVRDVIFKNIYIEKIGTEYKKMHIHCLIDVPGNSIKNVLFQNIHAKEPASNGSWFEGENLGATINNQKVQYYQIKFSNYTIGGKKVLSLTDAGAKFKLNASNVSANQNEFFFDAGVATVNECNDSNIKIYPNPTSNYVNVETTNNDLIDKISINSLQGKVLGLFSNTTKLDISPFPDGFYFVNIYNNQQTITKKVLVKK